MSKIRIGTRKSPLALAQAGQVRNRLLELYPGLSVEMVHITTSGDKFTDRPLADIGGKGLFTKEIEEALFDASIDIAVHSVKDMQTVLPNGLTIGCIPMREDPRDSLIAGDLVSLLDIPKGGTFGTSSLRRAGQVLMTRPDIKIIPLRGNVHTRLAKVEQGEIHATMLAMAGLNRLNIRAGTAIETADFLPAVGQGAIAIECRADDSNILELLAPLNHADTNAAVTCERAFLRALDGSCRTPIAGLAKIKGDKIQFEGLLVEPDGSRPKRIAQSGNISDAAQLGKTAGEALHSPK
jgi:hydroxymethylbilane synthase